MFTPQFDDSPWNSCEHTLCSPTHPRIISMCRNGRWLRNGVASVFPLGSICSIAWVSSYSVRCQCCHLTDPIPRRTLMAVSRLGGTNAMIKEWCLLKYRKGEWKCMDTQLASLTLNLAWVSGGADERQMYFLSTSLSKLEERLWILILWARMISSLSHEHCGFKAFSLHPL